MKYTQVSRRSNKSSKNCSRYTHSNHQNTIYLDELLNLSTLAKSRMIDCVCMCVSVSLKAGTNLPKTTRVITSLIGPSGDSGEAACCMLGQQWVCVVYLSGIPRRLPLWRYQGLSSPSCPSCIPAAVAFSTCSVLDLFPISSSEMKSKHWGDSQEQWRLKLASGWADAQSICSLIKYLHCANFLLLSPATCQFFSIRPLFVTELKSTNAYMWGKNTAVFHLDTEGFYLLCLIMRNMSTAQVIYHILLHLGTDQDIPTDVFNNLWVILCLDMHYQ